MTRTYSAWIRRLAKILCAVVWLAAATATHVPLPALGEVPAGDVVLHFTGFLGLACVFLLTLRLHGIPLPRRIVLSIPILLLYGVLDESTQPLVNRYCSLTDWLADAAGVFVAVGLDILLHLLQSVRNRKKV
jgi:VanZ family protein